MSDLKKEDDFNQASTHTSITWSQLARTLIPSAIGLFIFLAPVKFQGDFTIPIAIIVAQLHSALGPLVLLSLVTLCIATALGSILFSWIKLPGLPKHPLLTQVFDTTWFWVSARIFGAVFGIMFYLQIGPQLIISNDTGGTAFVNIGEQMLLIFVTSCLFLPLLTSYGAMEFVGTIVRPLFVRLFRLPGRAAIDATASFVAAASVGILITIEQYRNGSYNAREAAAVATNFSVISVPFAVLIASVANINEIFFPWYISVAVGCLIAAAITPRIPPLSRKPNTYLKEGARGEIDRLPGISLGRQAVLLSIKRADRAPGVKGYIKSSFQSMFDAVFGVIGASMGLVVIVMVIGLKTPVFTWLTLPLVPLLELMGLGNAEAAAPGILIGFLDMFLPAVIATGIDSDLTRFVLAGLSVAQLIYISEVGVLLLRSILPLTFSDLVLLFLQRTAILLPVFVIAGKLILP